MQYIGMKASTMISGALTPTMPSGPSVFATITT